MESVYTFACQPQLIPCIHIRNSLKDTSTTCQSPNHSPCSQESLMVSTMNSYHITMRRMRPSNEEFSGPWFVGLNVSFTAQQLEDAPLSWPVSWEWHHLLPSWVIGRYSWPYPRGTVEAASYNRPLFQFYSTVLSAIKGEDTEVVCRRQSVLTNTGHRSPSSAWPHMPRN